MVCQGCGQPFSQLFSATHCAFCLIGPAKQVTGSTTPLEVVDDYVVVDWRAMRCDLTYQERVKESLRWPDDRTITWSDVYRLFGRYDADASLRWTSSVDSAEYLAIVTYLVQRNSYEH